MTKPFDPTKPVQTRDGRPARILITDLKSEWSIAAAVNILGREELYSFTPDGYFDHPGNVNDLDLVNVPTKVLLEGWINVYPIGTNEMIHPTRESADRWEQGVDISRIACIHLKQEVSEGEGL